MLTRQEIAEQFDGPDPGTFGPTGQAVTAPRTRLQAATTEAQHDAFIERQGVHGAAWRIEGDGLLVGCSRGEWFAIDREGNLAECS